MWSSSIKSLKRKDENKLLVCEDLTVGPPGGFKPLNNIRLANSHVVLATGHVAVPLCEGESPVTGDVLTLHRLRVPFWTHSPQ